MDGRCCRSTLLSSPLLLSSSHSFSLFSLHRRMIEAMMKYVLLAVLACVATLPMVMAADWAVIGQQHTTLTVAAASHTHMHTHNTACSDHHVDTAHCSFTLCSYSPFPVCVLLLLLCDDSGRFIDLRQLQVPHSHTPSTQHDTRARHTLM